MSEVKYDKVLNAPQVFTKDPDEEWTNDAQRMMDFTQVLDGATIASVAITSEVVNSTEDTDNDGSTFVADNASEASGIVSYDVTGGYENADYAVKISATLDGGGVLVGYQRINVRRAYIVE